MASRARLFGSSTTRKTPVWVGSPVYAPDARARGARGWRRMARTTAAVWLYLLRRTRVASITWNEAVEEALCFGWIDSKAKPIDDQRYRQYSHRPGNRRASGRRSTKRVSSASSPMADARAWVTRDREGKANGSWRRPRRRRGARHSRMILLPQFDGPPSTRVRTQCVLRTQTHHCDSSERGPRPHDAAASSVAAPPASRIRAGSAPTCRSETEGQQLTGRAHRRHAR